MLRYFTLSLLPCVPVSFLSSALRCDRLGTAFIQQMLSECRFVG